MSLKLSLWLSLLNLFLSQPSPSRNWSYPLAEPDIWESSLLILSFNFLMNFTTVSCEFHRNRCLSIFIATQLVQGFIISQLNWSPPSYPGLQGSAWYRVGLLSDFISSLTLPSVVAFQHIGTLSIPQIHQSLLCFRIFCLLFLELPSSSTSC